MKSQIQNKKKWWKGGITNTNIKKGVLKNFEKFTGKNLC